MTSLYDDLAARLDKDPSLTKRGGPRYDLGLLLFDFREGLHELWCAAADDVGAAARDGREPPARLASAVAALRPLFGERGEA